MGLWSAAFRFNERGGPTVHPDSGLLFVVLTVAAVAYVPLLVLVCWFAARVWRADRLHRRGYWRKWLPDPEPRAIRRNEPPPADYVLPRNRVSRILPRR
jgi:hypothetical protein